MVTVTGRPEMVDEAIDHLLNLEEEYVCKLASNVSMRLCVNVYTVTLMRVMFKENPCIVNKHMGGKR